MKQKKIVLADMPLKDFLRLFSTNDAIEIIGLGDTMHPSSGYVGVELVSGIESVGQLLAMEYDFGGLDYFEAIINSLEVLYDTECYEIRSDDKSLAKVESSIRAINYQLDKAPFVVLPAY